MRVQISNPARAWKLMGDIVIWMEWAKSKYWLKKKKIGGWGSSFWHTLNCFLKYMV